MRERGRVTGCYAGLGPGFAGAPVMSDSVPQNLDLDGEYTVPFNGVEVPIEIESDSQRGQVQQQAALRLLLSLPPDILQDAAPAVVQNYEVYREAIGDEEMPPLANPVDVWKLVEPTSFLIPEHGAVTTPTFLLMAECDWDPEHGLVVRFRNGHADASNQQGELGIED